LTALSVRGKTEGTVLDSSIGASPSKLSARPATSGVSGSSARGSHRLAAALTCERLWALRYHMYIRPKAQKSYQLLGTLVHTILAYWFAQKTETAPAWLVEQPDVEVALLEDGKGYPDLIRQAKEIGEWCKHRYAAEHWHPLYVEEEFRSTLGRIIGAACPPDLVDEVITCRNDLVVVWNGEAWIVDHKTSRGSNSGRLAKWKEDGDFGLSFQGCQNLHICRNQDELPINYPLRGFAINRIKRTLPYDGDRHALRPPELAYNDSKMMMVEAVRREAQIIEKINVGGKPTPKYAACEGRYGKCDYFNVCAARSKEQQSRVLATEFSTPDASELVQLPTKA